MQEEGKTEIVNALSKGFDILVKVIMIVIGVMLWIQSQGDDKYFAKSAGGHMQEQIAEIKIELTDIKNDNKKLIEGLSRIEGKLEK